MIVVKLMQGLGNQMFQYAAAKSLSLKLNQPLKINIDNYSSASIRQYELGKYFGIQTPVITRQEMQQFNLSHPVRRVWNKLTKDKIRGLPYEESTMVQTAYQFAYLFRAPHKQKVFEERSFHFDERFFHAKPPVFLKGYWMSYKYFEQHRAAIMADFVVRKELVSAVKSIADEISANNSVALHIRCGDKLQPQYTQLLGTPSPEYYAAGINYISSQTNQPLKLYAFTDDVTVAKQYLPAGYDVTWVSNTTSTAVEDFYLMSKCKHLVMSNSTFSWWAGYQNTNNEKIIIIPKQWYANKKYYAKDLYYPGWVKL